jgi:hypothetical protein
MTISRQTFFVFILKNKGADMFDRRICVGLHDEDHTHHSTAGQAHPTYTCTYIGPHQPWDQGATWVFRGYSQEAVVGP